MQTLALIEQHLKQRRRQVTHSLGSLIPYIFIVKKLFILFSFVFILGAFTVNPASGSPLTSFQFDAAAGSDLEDPSSALFVRWDWDNNGSYDTNWSTTKKASHSFATIGVNTIRLQVRDTGGLTDTVIHQVAVSEKTSWQILLPLVVK